MEKYSELLGDIKHAFPKASNLEINVTVPKEEIIKFSDECKQDWENCLTVSEINPTPEQVFTHFKCPFGQINFIEEKL